MNLSRVKGPPMTKYRDNKERVILLNKIYNGWPKIELKELLPSGYTCPDKMCPMIPQDT